MKRKVLGRVWCWQAIGSNPDGTGEGEVLLFLTLPPDSNLILARETLPVTTGEGERLLIERGVTRVEFEFVGVAVVALKLK